MSDYEPFPDGDPGPDHSATRVANGGGHAAVVMPHNIEAEQALLGCLLVNNEAWTRVSDVLTADSFYEGLHARIWEATATLMGQGKAVTPVTLRTYFDHDDALQAVGGPAYLARLAGAAIATPHARDYAQAVRDLAIRRDMIRTGQDLIAVAEDIPVDLPVLDAVSEAEERLYALRPAYAGKATSEAQPAHVAGDAAMEQLARVMAGEDTPLRPTGIRALDRTIGGLEPGVVTVLGGRPSMGKTSLAVAIAMHEAGIDFAGVDGWTWRDQQRFVHFASLETPQVGIARRILSALSYRRWPIEDDMTINSADGFAGVSYDRLRRGNVPERWLPWLQQAREAMRDLPLHIDDRQNVNVPYIAQAARRTARKAEKSGGELGLIVVDHLTEIRDSGRWGDSRVNAVGENMGGLVTLARDMDVPVLVLAQLNRSVESRDNKRPQLSDLRETGEIEQKARMVLFPYREEYYLKRMEPDPDTPEHADWLADMEAAKDRIEIAVAKNNEGSTGTVKARARMPYGVFTDLPVAVGGDI